VVTEVPLQPTTRQQQLLLLQQLLLEAYYYFHFTALFLRQPGEPAPAKQSLTINGLLMAQDVCWNSHALASHCMTTRCSCATKLNKKLSYRKQIACQLCTQYVEGVSSNPVTLKSRLRVTQGHWKRYHLKAWVWFLFTFHSKTMAVSLAISEIFGVKRWHDLEIWVKVTENGAVQ